MGLISNKSTTKGFEITNKIHIELLDIFMKESTPEDVEHAVEKMEWNGWRTLERTPGCVIRENLNHNYCHQQSKQMPFTASGLTSRRLHQKHLDMIWMQQTGVRSSLRIDRLLLAFGTRFAPDSILKMTICRRLPTKCAEGARCSCTRQPVACLTACKNCHGSCNNPFNTGGWQLHVIRLNDLVYHLYYNFVS